MGFGDSDSENGGPRPQNLPSDLPMSLNDRRRVPVDLVPETEMYDGWQGAKPLSPGAADTDKE